MWEGTGSLSDPVPDPYPKTTVPRTDGGEWGLRSLRRRGPIRGVLSRRRGVYLFPEDGVEGYRPGRNRSTAPSCVTEGDEEVETPSTQGNGSSTVPGRGRTGVGPSLFTTGLVPGIRGTRPSPWYWYHTTIVAPIRKSPCLETA